MIYLRTILHVNEATNQAKWDTKKNQVTNFSECNKNEKTGIFRKLLGKYEDEIYRGICFLPSHNRDFQSISIV
ncbi:hypothetical protein C1I59_03255 [Paenibacillus polymyxa]|uniref:hypothetical protein n=1 Tax=Paenibacillus polymyxa TaxID=1406 RepID=UPI0001E6D3E7|nr:hypothetical protein C0638_04180 [Paenibacillus sp. lzh-N1]AZH27980.1 hypothetical protein EGM68_03990 [Paenibacillus sp. M-152]QOH60558.1 hypothetical protein DI243_03645 [Paenibacillus polymyxa]TKH39357.1 hypothetical protein C1I59_03255 [Paenibacillus polymyxa]CCC83634.1 hypothetical protein PPM_0697 [Paenibacillus polymyxa M1]